MSQAQSLDSFNCRRTLSAGGKSYVYFDLKEAEKNGLDGVSRLPFSLKVLLENLLRHEDGRYVGEWINDDPSLGSGPIELRPE